jgi:hypothetical protein
MSNRQQPSRFRRQYHCLRLAGGHPDPIRCKSIVGRPARSSLRKPAYDRVGKVHSQHRTHPLHSTHALKGGHFLSKIRIEKQLCELATVRRQAPKNDRVEPSLRPVGAIRTHFSRFSSPALRRLIITTRQSGY